jgi:sugar lactone lactonase YvrE
VSAGSPAPLGAGPFQLAEGPAWDNLTNTVSFVDVTAGALHRLRLDSGGVETLLQRDEPVTFGLPHASGGLLVGHGRSVSHLSPSGELTTLIDQLPGTGPDVRVNDAAVDAEGRLVVGTMAYDARTPTGALYVVGLDLKVRVLRDGIVCSNGLGWSGELMYHADTVARRIDVYRYDAATGTVGPRDLFVAVHNGKPDGLSVDAEGCVWLAVWGGGQVRLYTPRGHGDAGSGTRSGPRLGSGSWCHGRGRRCRPART